MGGPKANQTLISQMVDNILKDSEEVGHSDDDGSLSGDEIKTPIFVIKRDTGPRVSSGDDAMRDSDKV